MLKLAKYLYNMGRRQAYTEVLTHLETLAVKLPRNREGQLLRQPIDDTIKAIRAEWGKESK